MRERSRHSLTGRSLESRDVRRVDGRPGSTTGRLCGYAAALAIPILMFALNGYALSTGPYGHCLAVARSSVSRNGYVKVAEIGMHRMLYFSKQADCPKTLHEAPFEWQSRAMVECPRAQHVESGFVVGHGCSLAAEFFPDDYLGLFVSLVALLPPTLRTAEPRVLILGGGAGVLANLLTRVLPLRPSIDVVEPDKSVLSLARAYMGLPPAEAVGSIQVHVDDAAHYVSTHAATGRKPYHLIVLDAFENDGDESATPRAWGTEREWCTQLRAILDERHGVLAANLYGHDETTRPFRKRCDQAFVQAAMTRGTNESYRGGYALACQGSSSSAACATRLVMQAGPRQTVEAWNVRPSWSQGEFISAAAGVQFRSSRAVDLGGLVRRAWRTTTELHAKPPRPSSRMQHPEQQRHGQRHGRHARRTRHAQTTNQEVTRELKGKAERDPEQEQDDEEEEEKAEQKEEQQKEEEEKRQQEEPKGEDHEKKEEEQEDDDDEKNSERLKTEQPPVQEAEQQTSGISKRAARLRARRAAKLQTRKERDRKETSIHAASPPAVDAKAETDDPTAAREASGRAANGDVPSVQQLPVPDQRADSGTSRDAVLSWMDRHGFEKLGRSASHGEPAA